MSTYGDPTITIPIAMAFFTIIVITYECGRWLRDKRKQKEEDKK